MKKHTADPSEPLSATLRVKKRVFCPAKFKDKDTCL